MIFSREELQKQTTPKHNKTKQHQRNTKQSQTKQRETIQNKRIQKKRIQYKNAHHFFIQNYSHLRCSAVNTVARCVLTKAMACAHVLAKIKTRCALKTLSGHVTSVCYISKHTELQQPQSATDYFSHLLYEKSRYENCVR